MTREVSLTISRSGNVETQIITPIDGVGLSTGASPGLVTDYLVILNETTAVASTKTWSI